MIKGIKGFLLTSVALGFLQYETLAMIEENDHNKKNPVAQLRIDPWDGYYQDLAEEEEKKRSECVWNRAIEVKKRIKFLEAEIVEEAKKPGEIPAEYPDEASFTFRYHDLTKELEELREEQMEINQHFGGVNPPTSGDEEEINGKDDYTKEIRERALRKGLLIPKDVDPREVEGQINTYDPSQEALEDERDRRREIYGNSDSE